ncbi:CLUMA_CG009039, isoform A [Clunio marinus]|uniref:CLUMA_CG009039, isoform A n=1 Tax=Clunio marinus TaxID=568069 RepID=A0A1J1I754_9DIPT|nr:CLUMA_CG009039, isoform A [Clunio marinus]
MKIAIAILIAIIGSSLAAPAKDSQILEENFIRDDFGQYSYNFLSGDGVARTEQGSFKTNEEGTGNILVQKGGYRYLLPGGELVEVNYVADENGFRVTGTHLPTPPPLPVV